MKKILQSIDLILEKNINNQISWLPTILVFTCYGGLMLFYMFREELLISDMSFKSVFVRSLSLIILSIPYGVITSILLCFLMAKLYILFKIKVSFQNLVKVFKTAYKPSIFIFIILIARIFVANYFTAELIDKNPIFIAIGVTIINLIIALLGIWMLVILFKGLMKISNLSLERNILVYFGAVIIVYPINLLIM